MIAYLSIDQWQTLRTLPRLCCPLVELYTSVSRVYASQHFVNYLGDQSGFFYFFDCLKNPYFWDDVCGSEKDIFDRFFSRQMIRCGKLVNSPFAIFQLPRTALLLIYELAAILKFVAPKLLLLFFTIPLAFPTVKFIIQREKPTAFIMN